MPTDQNLRDSIVAETGLASDVNINTWVPIWWSLFSADYDQMGAYLFTKRTALVYAMGQIRQTAVDNQVGTSSFDLSQRVKNIVAMIQATDTQIDLQGIVAELRVASPCAPNMPDAEREVYEWYSLGQMIGVLPYGDW